MLTLMLVSIPISLLNVLNEIAALTLVRGADFLSVLDKPHRDAMAMLFLDLHRYGVVVPKLLGSLARSLWDPCIQIGFPATSSRRFANHRVFRVSR